MKKLLLPLLLIIPISLNANTGSKSSNDGTWYVATSAPNSQETKKPTTATDTSSLITEIKTLIQTARNKGGDATELDTIQSTLDNVQKNIVNKLNNLLRQINNMISNLETAKT